MSGQDFPKPKRKNAVSFQSPFECDSSSLKQYGLPPLTPLDKPSYSRTSSIVGLSIFDGFSAAGSVVGADWLEEIDFAFKELTLENDLEIKAENTISEDEKNIEFRNVKLTVEEEREIQRKVRSQLAHEFKKIYFEARDRNKQIKKIFRSYLEEARSSILKIRVAVDDNTTETLERTAEEEHAKILKKRAKIKEKSKMENETTDRTSLTDAEMNKEKALELAHVRKIHADLDRARTRRQKNDKEAEKKQKFKKNDALLHLEIKKLERDSEVHSLILQLYESDLHENARTLTNALSAKEMSEKRLREQMKMKKAVAKARAMAKLRSEWLEEKARKERERLEMERLRKEREEKERRKRIMAALKRKARNQERQCWAMTSFLGTRTSRPYSFSYF